MINIEILLISWETARIFEFQIVKLSYVLLTPLEKIPVRFLRRVVFLDKISQIRLVYFVNNHVKHFEYITNYQRLYKLINCVFYVQTSELSNAVEKQILYVFFGKCFVLVWVDLYIICNKVSLTL